MQPSQRLFLVVCLATLALSAPPQASSAPRPQGSDSGRSTTATKTAKDFPDEPLIYELVRGTMRYENDGTGSREIRARIRVQTALGLQRVGQLQFDYNAANERLDIRSVRVIKPDGAIVIAGPEAVQDLSAPVAREAPMYTDARQKHVSVPGLSVGDVVEYDVVATVTDPLTPNQFWQTWSFVSDSISLDEQVELNAPRSRALKLQTPPDVTMTQHDEGDRRVYHWSTSTLAYAPPANLPDNARFDPKKLLEIGVPKPSRRLMFSTFQSWDQMGGWYRGLESDRKTVTPELKTKADEIVKDAASSQAKAEALYQWVSANIRYVSLSFGLGRYQPHSAAEVLANRYGDCKDKATLLEALLESEGLHAATALINTGADADPAVPSPLQFDHAITLLSLDGKETWLDSTIGAGPFGYLLPQLRDKNALVVTASGTAALRKTPAELATAPLYDISVQDDLDANNQHDLHISFATRGDLEVLLRLGFMQLSPEQLAGFFNQGLRSGAGANAPSLDGLKTGSPTDTREPFKIEGHLSGLNQNSSDQPGMPVLLTSLPALGSALSAALPDADSASGESEGGTLGGVKIKGPAEYRLSLTFTGPSLPGAQAPSDSHKHIAKSFAVFDSDEEWNGRTLTAKWRLTVIAPEVSKEQMTEYGAFRREVAASMDTNSEFSAHLLEGYVAANPKDGDSALRLGDMYIQLHDYDKAVPPLKHATELLPMSDPAFQSLGRAYLGMHDYDKAIDAFQKMLQINDNEWSYNNAAYFLGEENAHMDVAEKWARAAIGTVATQLNQTTLSRIDKNSAQLTGELAAFWDTYGWIKFHENDLGAAEKYIRASWDIANYTDVGAHLGRIYQAEGRKSDAIQAYARTLALTASSRPMSDNEKDARQRLVDLAGGDSQADDRVKEERSKANMWRSAEVKNAAHLEGKGNFILLVGPESKVADVKPARSFNKLAELADSIRATAMPQVFPDGSVQRLPRAASLNCEKADQPCILTLMPPIPAGQVFPATSPDLAQ